MHGTLKPGDLVINLDNRKFEGSRSVYYGLVVSIGSSIFNESDCICKILWNGEECASSWFKSSLRKVNT